MTSQVFTSPADLGEYLFRITDNGGDTADRYTVVFSDGSYLSLSSNPSHPQGVSLSGEGIDLDWLNDQVENGTALDLQLGDLPNHLREHIKGRENEGLSDFLEAVERRDPSAVAPSRDKAKANDGTHESLGVGIYSAGEGYCIKREGDDGADDLGPYLSAAEAVRNSLPDRYALAGPEYHSTVEPASLRRVKGTAAAIRKLEKVRDAEYRASRGLD